MVYKEDTSVEQQNREINAYNRGILDAKSSSNTIGVFLGVLVLALLGGVAYLFFADSQEPDVINIPAPEAPEIDVPDVNVDVPEPNVNIELPTPELNSPFNSESENAPSENAGETSNNSSETSDDASSNNQ